MIRLLFFIIALLFTSVVEAADPMSPVGRWVTISDKTHDRAGTVDIYEQNGQLYGKITKIFPGADRNPSDLCTKCDGKRKNKPVLGMVFLWGFKPQGNGVWGGGEILDPKEGKIYKGKIKISDGGRKLDVRGYWGVFWRTQTWLREK